MPTYRQELISIRDMLKVFVERGKIDTDQLTLMDELIKRSAQDQFKVLNNAYLSLDAQRSYFGAIRNINVSMSCIKAKLEDASARHENPTTAELALELLPSFFNLVPYIDEFLDEAKATKAENVSRFSRILYRKAKLFGFSKDMISQLNEAGVTKTQIKNFIDKFNQNVASELDIEEEVSSNNEDSNRNVDTS